jgi:hypothetical protein
MKGFQKNLQTLGVIIPKHTVIDKSKQLKGYPKLFSGRVTYAYELFTRYNQWRKGARKIVEGSTKKNLDRNFGWQILARVLWPDAYQGVGAESKWWSWKRRYAAASNWWPMQARVLGAEVNDYHVQAMTDASQRSVSWKQVLADDSMIFGSCLQISRNAS